MVGDKRPLGRAEIFFTEAREAVEHEKEGGCFPWLCFTAQMPIADDANHQGGYDRNTLRQWREIEFMIYNIPQPPQRKAHRARDSDDVKN